MKRRDRLAVLALLVLLAAVGGAMLLPGAPAAPDAPAATPTGPSVTLHEAVIGHPSSINPLTARTQADRDLVSLLFRGLLKEGPDGSLQPDLAKSWTISPDGKTYTFYMVSDARWEDGEPVTASDVVFTAGLASDPEYQGPLGASWQGVTAQAVSAHVVKIVLPSPLGGFLRQATLPLLPGHVLKGVGVADLAGADFSARPMGDGRYRLVEIDSSHAVLARSPTGPGSETARPSATGKGSGNPAPSAASPSATATATPAAVGDRIGEVELRFFDDAAGARSAFLAGQVDAVGGLGPDDVAAAMARAGSRTVRYPWADLTAVVLNQRTAHPEFAAAGVRRSLLSAIDRPGVLTRILSGRGSLAEVPLPFWSTWYDSSAVTTVPYLGHAAEEGLANAGWTRGQNGVGWLLPGKTVPYSLKLLTLDAASNPTLNRVAQQVATDWREIGIQVTVTEASVKDYRDALQNSTFDAAVVEYKLGLDPDVSALLLSSQSAPAGSNLSGVADQTLDRLLQAVRTTTDAAARKKAVSALESYVSSNVLMLPICFSDYSLVVSGGLSGVAPGQIADPSDRYWDVLDWRLASDG